MNSLLIGLMAYLVSDIDAITSDLKDDEDTDAWEKQFALLLAAYLLAAYLLGKEGTEVTDAESTFLEELVDSQLEYLAGFADEIRENIADGWQDGWESRARQYGESVIEGYWLGEISDDPEREWTWQWDETMEIERHCNSCKALNGVTRPAKEWIAERLLPGSIEHLDCGQGCRCTLS